MMRYIIISAVLVIGLMAYITKDLNEPITGNTVAKVSTVTQSGSMFGINLSETDASSSTTGKDRITSTYRFDARYFRIVQDTAIRLETEIKEPEIYKDVDRVLQEAKDGDTVTFYLAGYGGREDACIEITSNIKRSKAIVTMVVDAPVYSADAMLAVSGDRLIVSDDAFLMFHAPANGDGKMSSQIDCSTLVGEDRGHPESLQCEADKAAQVKLDTKLINELGYLTPAEKAQILAGYEVYLFPADILARGKKV